MNQCAYRLKSWPTEIAQCRSVFCRDVEDSLPLVRVLGHWFRWAPKACLILSPRAPVVASGVPAELVVLAVQPVAVLHPGQFEEQLLLVLYQ